MKRLIFILFLFVSYLHFNTNDAGLLTDSPAYESCSVSSEKESLYHAGQKQMAASNPLVELNFEVGQFREDITSRSYRSPRYNFSSAIFSLSPDSFFRNIRLADFRKPLSLNSQKKEILHLNHTLRI